MRESVFLLPMYTRLNIAEFCNTVITGVIFLSLYPSPEGVLPTPQHTNILSDFVIC